MAQRYHQRPSALVEIADRWLAYQFDCAVMALAMLKETDAGAGETASPARHSSRDGRLRDLRGMTTRTGSFDPETGRFAE